MLELSKLLVAPHPLMLILYILSRFRNKDIILFRLELFSPTHE